MAISPGTAATALFMGLTATAAVLFCGPIASADDPDQTDDQTTESSAGEPSGGGAAKPTPKGAENPAEHGGELPPGDLADKNCWVINGVPKWNEPGKGIGAILPGDTAFPCYMVYGLQPH